MEKKADTWNKTCNRFVAFLDIMGFRDRVYRESHEDVKKMLESFQPTIGGIDNRAKILLAMERKNLNREKKILKTPIIRVVSFSDSIILISNDDSLDSASQILSVVIIIISEAMNKNIPIKGAIAYGEQTADFKKSLHFGKPLIDAFELQNELLLYGIVLHHSFEKKIIEENYLELFGDELIYKYPVPMKGGKITHYIVNWVCLYGRKFDLVDFISQFYKNVSGPPRQYVDNTLDFVRSIKRKDSLAKKKIPSHHSKEKKEY